MRAADGRGEGEGLACPVKVAVRRGRVVYRGGARTADDILARRTRLTFLNATASASAIGSVELLLKRELAR